jgi:hypothetical protein
MAPSQQQPTTLNDGRGNWPMPSTGWHVPSAFYSAGFWVATAIVIIGIAASIRDWLRPKAEARGRRTAGRRKKTRVERK